MTHLVWPLQHLLGCKSSVPLKFVIFCVQTPLPFSSPAQCHKSLYLGLGSLRCTIIKRLLHTADYKGSRSISFPPDVVGLHSVFPNLQILQVHDPWFHAESRLTIVLFNRMLLTSYGILTHPGSIERSSHKWWASQAGVAAMAMFTLKTVRPS